MSKKYEKELISMGKIDIKKLKEEGYADVYDRKNRIILSIFKDKKGSYWLKAEKLKINKVGTKEENVPF